MSPSCLGLSICKFTGVPALDAGMELELIRDMLMPHFKMAAAD